MLKAIWKMLDILTKKTKRSGTPSPERLVCQPRTASAWTYYLFQKLQNAIFLEIFQIPASG